MIKKEYEIPEMEVVRFATDDCMTASIDTVNAGDMPT